MTQRHQVLDKLFREFGCDTSRPGFCNSSQFLEAERRDPELLDKYAEYVLTCPSHGDEEKIRKATKFVYSELEKDGRMGACIDASCLLSEFFNREKIWSFVVKGGTSLRFTSGRDPVRFAAITSNDNPADAGHAWVVAPPFKVVDVTLPFQKYQPSVRRMLPRKPIMSKTPSEVQPETVDLVDVDVESDVIRSGGIKKVLDAGVWRRIRMFGSWGISVTRAVEVRYVAVATTAISEPLEDWQNIHLNGLSAGELWTMYQTKR